MQWRVLFHPAARQERRELPEQERLAMATRPTSFVLGPAVPFPHSSDVRGADRLRELRPRGGRSRWRALYRRVGEVFVVAAIAAEAQVDPRGFKRAVAVAEERLAQIEEEAT
jgi:hypothetical protein